jgi:DNA polymerase-1
MADVVALIDADVLCYTAALVSAPEIDFDGEGAQAYENPERAKQVADEAVNRWTRAAGCTEARLVFSDRSHSQATFRYGVHPKYKETRGSEKPPLHDMIYSYLHSNKDVETVEKKGLEGDDVLGLMITGPNKDKYMAVSVDKDMLTVPGNVCIIPCGPNPPEAKPQVISLYQADYNWMFQTLTGDTVDNYKGAPGIGKVGAQKLLAGAANLEAMWSRVIDGYNTQFAHEKWTHGFLNATAWDEAIMNARCARILRYGDYDPNSNLVKLWHPDAGHNEWMDL